MLQQDAGNVAGDGVTGTGVQQQQDAGTNGNVQGETSVASTWDEYLESLPENLRTMYDAHTQGLRTALVSERDQRKEMDKQLRDAIAGADEGSKLKTAMEGLQKQLEQAELRAEFAEESIKQNITNPSLAWLAVQQHDMFDRKGNVDWAALKERFPELFKVSLPNANAGSGTNTANVPQGDMNKLIRDMANRL